MDSSILALGGSLLIVNGISSGQMAELWDIISNANTPATAANHSHVVMLFGELTFIFILAFFGGADRNAGEAITWLLVALWILYLMKNGSYVSKWLSGFTQATSGK